MSQYKRWATRLQAVIIHTCMISLIYTQVSEGKHIKYKTMPSYSNKQLECKIDQTFEQTDLAINYGKLFEKIDHLQNIN